MHITKIFNNNCVATFIDGDDMVVTGSGIGFQHKIGDEIDPARIEKMFKVVSDSRDDFERLVNKIPVDYFEVTRAIVEHANTVLNTELSDSINVSLTDHIYYAVLRHQEGIELPGVFSEEIKMYYPDEFEVGSWALNHINKRFNVELAEDEIGYIVMHIVNASKGNISHQAQNTMMFLKDVMAIVQSELGVEINTSQPAYTRLATHLKYLAQRIIGNQSSGHPIDESIGELNIFIAAKLKRYNDCVAKINQYVNSRFDYELSMDERMYLAIHLYQIMKNETKKNR